MHHVVSIPLIVVSQMSVFKELSVRLFFWKIVFHMQPVIWKGNLTCIL